MGFFDKFKKAAAPAAKPAAVAAQAAPGVVCAPVSGDMVELAAVGDGVFSAGILGPGCAVEPTDEVAYAPVTGTVTATMDANHAMGITSDDGVEVLVHVGIDTVEMQGKGFARFAEQGAKVCAGDPILKFSLADIKAAGHPATVMCLVSNSAEYEAVDVLETGAVEAGTALLSVK
jgi:glucose-specific phosphotransferase system IIA component